MTVLMENQILLYLTPEETQIVMFALVHQSKPAYVHSQHLISQASVKQHWYLAFG